MSNIKTRLHKIMALRGAQLLRNELSVIGGRPYIDARLWRAANETELSWQGDVNTGVVGRKERAALVNDASRVAIKINQYIFKNEITRTHADETFIRNCTGTGESVTDFMSRVSLALTWGGWCWLQADRVPLKPEGETLADRAPIKWTLWTANDVPDWSLDANGEINWLITRSTVYINTNPHKEAVSATISTLYERDPKDGCVYITEESSVPLPDTPLRTRVLLPGLKQVPFVLVGRPSIDPWWFDDVEFLQAQILNLDSLHLETLTTACYPQLVIPNSLVDTLETRLREEQNSMSGDKIVSIVKELTLGRKVPIVESGEDKGVARYIMPGGDCSLLTQEATRKRGLIFDLVGLTLFNHESRQQQTAESKQFDQMDTNATLGYRARILKAAEIRLIALSKVFDGAFQDWEPNYPTSFDVMDVAAVSQALVAISNTPDQTPCVRKIIAKANVRILKELADGIATEDEFAEALKEIDETDFMNDLPDPFRGVSNEPDDEPDDDYTPITREEAERIFDEIMAKRKGQNA